MNPLDTLEKKILFWKERFHGRQEVFGRKISYFSHEEGKMVSTYNPVYVEKYRSKEARKNQVFSSPSELYQPLTNTDISGHLDGTAELLIYVLHAEGTCKFAAMDFDHQHSWEDVRLITDTLKALGVPHGIARSTTKGHHVYIFFDRHIEAKYVTSFVHYVYQQVGFHDRLKNGEYGKNGKPWSNPEMFPKTISLGDAVSTGYGIKPPMHGAGMQRSQNCWVDENDKPIGGVGNSPEQWEYFAAIPTMAVKDFLKLIEDKEIPVDSIRLSEKRGAVKQREYKRVTEYKPPEDGDFMLIVNGCPSLKRIWAASNAEMSHEARVALLSFALRTKNGISILRERFGNSEAAEKQIQYAIDTSQSPWTCQTMQQYGICVTGRDPVKQTGLSKDAHGVPLNDHCFERVPPRETVNGKVVINPNNVPEDEWPWPSPVRLRVPYKVVSIDTVKTEIDALDKDDIMLSEKISALFKTIVSLRDTKLRKEAVDYLKARKLISAKDINTFEKEAKREKAAERAREVSVDTGFREVNGTRYSTIEGGGYAIVHVDAEGELTFNPISNFEIVFKEDVTKHTIMGEKIRTFDGHIVCAGRNIAFRVSSEEWYNNSKLAVVLGTCVGTSGNFAPTELNHIRNATHAFGGVNLTRKETYEDYGFDDIRKPTVYRSTKYNITATSFDNETDSYVDLSDGVEARNLCLAPISKEDFIQTVKVIKTDLLNLQSHYITYTVIAHTFQAAIHNVYIPMPESPILWLQGLTGSGKSQLAKFAQSFHGNFEKLVSIQTTSRSLETYTMLFKDALLVLDDYKEAFFREGTIKLIQKIYDRAARGRLGTNLKQSATINARGLVMVTAEDAPTSEASVIARLILIESKERTSGHSIKATDALRKVVAAQPYFNGVMCKFIQYMLQNYPKPEVVHSKFFELTDLLRNKIKDEQNSTRIANNLAANYLTWELFLEFLMFEGVLSKDEFSQFRQTHWENIEGLRTGLVSACGREQASNVFLHYLRELILSGKYKIDGLGNDNKNAQSIGWVDHQESDTVFLFPSICVGLVKKVAKELGSSISHSEDSIGKQLIQDKIITQIDGKYGSRVRRRYKGTRTLVWAVSAELSGLSSTNPDNPGAGMEETVAEGQRTDEAISNVASMLGSSAV